MARGRAPGYEDQRVLILDRAALLFARKGYVATSMNEVAEACGLSKATLYHYFRDKRSLLFHITHDNVARLRAIVAEVAARELAPEACLRELVRRLVAAYAGAQAAHRVLTEDVRFLPPPERERVLQTEREIVAGIARAVAGVRPDLGTMALGKPLAMLLFGMINWMFTWMRPDGVLDYDAIAPVVADLFVGGLHAVRPPPARAAPRGGRRATGSAATGNMAPSKQALGDKR